MLLQTDTEELGNASADVGGLSAGHLQTSERQRGQMDSSLQLRSSQELASLEARNVSASRINKFMSVMNINDNRTAGHGPRLLCFYCRVATDFCIGCNAAMNYTLHIVRLSASKSMRNCHTSSAHFRYSTPNCLHPCGITNNVRTTLHASNASPSPLHVELALSACVHADIFYSRN